MSTVRSEKVMLLAAGLGTRLTPLTDDIPKPMVPVLNRPVMEHLVRLLSRQGFRDIVVNLHYRPEEIESYFGNGGKWGVRLSYSREERLMGTAGGVKGCEEFFEGGTFLVLSGDALTDLDLGELLSYHYEKRAMATVVVTGVDDTSAYGVVVFDEEGRITGFQEKPTEAEAASRVANSGIYVFEPSVLDLIPGGSPYDFGRELFPRLVETNEALFAWEHDYYWNDVGSIREYQRGNFDALEEKVHVDVPGVEVASGVWVGGDTRIERDVLITPPVCIGERCKIAERVRVFGPVVVGPDTEVSSGAVLFRGIKWGGGYIGRDASVVGSIICSGSRIGDKSAVLEGAVLGSGTVVGDGIVIDPSVKIVSGTAVDETACD